MKNKHGLSRTPSEEVMREVRKRCGFGCVICGFAFFDYEHFDPEFADAYQHNPDGMTLLCPTCNQKKRRGWLSTETVIKANNNPKCLEQGYSGEVFDFGCEPLTVHFAGVKTLGCETVIEINGLPLLSISPPASKNEPIQLSGFFTNRKGQIKLAIDKNNLFLNINNWDVKVKGSLITIREGLGDISLKLRMNPPSGIAIEKIDMSFQGVHLRGDEKILHISTDGGKNWNSLAGAVVQGCAVGVSINVGYKPANDQIFSIESLFP